MNRRLVQASVLFGVAAVLSATLFVGRKAKAQPQVIPMHGVFNGPISPFYVIPTSPPVVSVQQRLHGESNVFTGPVEWIDTHTVHFGVENGPLRFTDGTGVVQSGNDGMFVYWNGNEAADLDPTKRGADGVATVVGGRGRFRNATGSGSVHTTLDLIQGTIVVTVDVTLVIPE